MKKLLFVVICMILIGGFSFSYARTSSPQPETAAPANEDTQVDVVGYFGKNDTVDYWISESEWRFRNGDTIKTQGISTKVRIVVTDSTASGYKMKYTFLDCVGDTSVGNWQGTFQNKIVESVGKKVVGTTIEFETDEFGHITKFNNLDKIKKQAKILYKECMEEFANMDEAKALKDSGIDIQKFLTKNIDTDKMVEEYTEELNMLFECHGNSYTVGEQNTHQAATDEEYESDTFIIVSKDDEDDYHLCFDVVSKVPQSAVKEMMGEVADMFGKSDMKESINNEVDKYANVDLTIESYRSMDFMWNGWPYKVLEQTTSMYGKNGKVKQTYIWIDNFSAGN